MALTPHPRRVGTQELPGDVSELHHEQGEVCVPVHWTVRAIDVGSDLRDYSLRCEHPCHPGVIGFGPQVETRDAALDAGCPVCLGVAAAERNQTVRGTVISHA